jgi:alpha-beta hydrolase superfamily lysophospholipase
MSGEFRFLVDGTIPVLKVHHEPRPGPAVLMLHGMTANADVQRKELWSLADAGLAAVGLDAPHHGRRQDGWLTARSSSRYTEAHAAFLHMLREAIAEIPRVIDHLIAEGHGPIGICGISLGGYTALGAAALEPRIRATVAIIASPDWAPFTGVVTEEIAELMKEAPVHRPAEVARHPLLLLNAGKDEKVSPHGARELVARVASQHPQLAGHVGHVEYPESYHAVRPDDWHDLWGRTLGFFRQHLGA